MYIPRSKHPDVNSSWNPYFSCDFETSTQGGNIYSMKGPYLSHSATSKLVLNIKRLGEPLVQISTASNKKAANAQCALKMVGELYRRNLIERFGEDKIQKPLSPALIGGENESIGEKRKIEGEEEPVQFDENGNWTLELARSRLSEFYQKQEKQLNCDERNSVGKILNSKSVFKIQYFLYFFRSRTQNFEHLVPP